jgi:hypothetical protein
MDSSLRAILGLSHVLCHSSPKLFSVAQSALSKPVELLGMAQMRAV